MNTLGAPKKVNRYIGPGRGYRISTLPSHIDEPLTEAYTIIISKQFHAVQRHFSLNIIDVAHNWEPLGAWDRDRLGAHGKASPWLVGLGKEIAGVRLMLDWRVSCPRLGKKLEKKKKTPGAACRLL